MSSGGGEMKRKGFLVVCGLLILTLPGCFEYCQSDEPEVMYHQCDEKLENDTVVFGQSIFELDAQSLREIIRLAWDESDVREFKDLEEFAVIDVRGYEQYVSKRIRGSVNVELKDLKHESERWEASRKLIVYSGGDGCKLASKAAFRLVSYGFKKVFVYSGGMFEWMHKGFETDGC